MRLFLLYFQEAQDKEDGKQELMQRLKGLQNSGSAIPIDATLGALVDQVAAVYGGPTVAGFFTNQPWCVFAFDPKLLALEDELHGVKADRRKAESHLFALENNEAGGKTSMPTNGGWVWWADRMGP